MGGGGGVARWRYIIAKGKESVPGTIIAGQVAGAGAQVVDAGAHPIGQGRPAAVGIGDNKGLNLIAIGVGAKVEFVMLQARGAITGRAPGKFGRADALLPLVVTNAVRFGGGARSAGRGGVDLEGNKFGG